MKILATLFLIVLFSNTLFAQKKGDNTVIVHGFVPYDRLKEVLFENGFVTINSDTAFISTNGKAMGFVGDVSYILRKTDSTLTLKGYAVATLAGYSSGKTLIDNKGDKGSANRVGFATMNKIANSFGLPVSYLKAN